MFTDTMTCIKSWFCLIKKTARVRVNQCVSTILTCSTSVEHVKRNNLRTIPIIFHFFHMAYVCLIKF